ncbi:MAG: 23S rRNA (pseudouridine(1915)-N(3))-methyltransferase RlmH, partial [Bacteroidales bacterium]|nr:23S rRNA (pseudouridine(1915)-N(3))-methyltransferase RlmH [Bacteroidales bacterium]
SQSYCVAFRYLIFYSYFCNEKISLSKMTFSHQMVRLFFIEQIYRAFTIMNGEPYHHE